MIDLDFHPTGRHFLQIPGPSPVPDRILRAMSLPTIDHRGPEFGALGKQVLAGLRKVFQTRHPVVVYASSGTGAWEGALVNTLSPGDAVLMVETGHFAALWQRMAARLGLAPEILCAPGPDPLLPEAPHWRQAARPEQIEERLRRDREKKIKAVCVVHNETSTGALFPVHEIARAARARGVVTIVDAVTSFGVYDLRFDRSDLDGIVWGSQKGMMIPPGLGYVAYSARAWEVAEKAKLPRFYWNLLKARKELEAPDTPFTPAITLVLAAHAAAKLMAAEGRENVFARHQRNADATRAAAQALGMSLLAEVPSNAVTAVNAPMGLDSGAVVKTMEKKYGVKIAGGQNQLKGKIFRLGHIGYYDEGDILRMVGAFESALIDHGWKAEPGTAVKAAQASYRGAGKPAGAPVS